MLTFVIYQVETFVFHARFHSMPCALNFNFKLKLLNVYSNMLLIIKCYNSGPR